MKRILTVLFALSIIFGATAAPQHSLQSKEALSQQKFEKFELKKTTQDFKKINHVRRAPKANNEVISISLSGMPVEFTDAIQSKGWWQIRGNNDDYICSLSNAGEITYIAGTYTVEDLDPDASFVYKYSTKKKITLVSGSVTLTVAENTSCSAVGEFVGDDGNTYKVSIVSEGIVLAPNNVQFVEYSMSYSDYDKKQCLGSAFVGVDGNDVYIKGFSSVLPNALIKGTKEGNTVSFPGWQFLGKSGNYSIYSMYELELVYDATTNSYTATNSDKNTLLSYAINKQDQEENGRDFYGSSIVLRHVEEKAVKPANPSITALKNSRQYGYYIEFDIPLLDVNGDLLLASKLSYQIYTESAGTQTAITFTPETHTKLTGNMSVIPYGFTDNWDFYESSLYFNELYSDDWKRIGIKSIYTGGGTTNSTDIIWYKIPKLVVLPEGVELVEYALKFVNSIGHDTLCRAAVGVDGNNVYFQGFSHFLPNALIKGTKSGNSVTFEPEQYLGSTQSGDILFMEDATDNIVFTYDSEADTYAATGNVYSKLASKNEDIFATNPVLTRIEEKAIAPAAPTISSFQKHSKDGYILRFNIPIMDVNGDPLLTSKLSYQVFIDIDGMQKPLKFSSDTHKKLTEEMSIIPYGFTENDDFYVSAIYLNSLYSSSWSKIGIKSIYAGGGATNESDIVWHNLKEASAVGNISDDAQRAKKIVENGQLFILRDGIKYNVLGVQVNK